MNDTITGSGDPIAIMLAQIETEADHKKAEEPEPSEPESDV